MAKIEWPLIIQNLPTLGLLLNRQQDITGNAFTILFWRCPNRSDVLTLYQTLKQTELE